MAAEENDLKISAEELRRKVNWCVYSQFADHFGDQLLAASKVHDYLGFDPLGNIDIAIQIQIASPVPTNTPILKSFRIFICAGNYAPDTFRVPEALYDYYYLRNCSDSSFLPMSRTGAAIAIEE